MDSSYASRVEAAVQVNQLDGGQRIVITVDIPPTRESQPGGAAVDGGIYTVDDLRKLRAASEGKSHAEKAMREIVSGDGIERSFSPHLETRLQNDRLIASIYRTMKQLLADRHTKTKSLRGFSPE